MDTLKLLIVDDDADNRLVLHTICKKFDGFEIKEAADGQEAVDTADAWAPDIILMDIMMPRMDGFEASKIIKSRHPKCVIMVVSAALDDKVHENFSTIGVEIYIHKPIDKELLRFKLQSVATTLRMKQGDFMTLSKKNAINPFTSDIRSFRTLFDVVGPEGMMDFGMWLLDEYSGKALKNSRLLDSLIELFYTLLNLGYKNDQTLSIVVEESFEEYFISILFQNPLDVPQEIIKKVQELGVASLAKEALFSVRLDKALNLHAPQTVVPQKVEAAPKIVLEPTVSDKEKKVIDSTETALLKQSFVTKTTAEDYVRDIGGDVLDEILELESIDGEWADSVRMIEEAPTPENFAHFCDSVLHAYVRVINNLFEFTALAYALSSLAAFLKDAAPTIAQDEKKVKTLVMLLEHLLEDLSSWREHIFILKDTADIHYLDSSFFSSCMQIEMLISEKDLVVDGDDDHDMEFF